MTDVYVVIHIATTCDDNNNYISRDSTEVIEFSWSIVDALELKIDHTQNIYIKPINTPITANCSQVTRVTWEHVKNAGSFKDAITQFDNYITTNLVNKNRDFTFVTMDISKLKVQLPREARDKGVVLPPYLQHPRIFDLQNEYCKWQTSHPEALSYGSNSLMNIVTALEVDIGSTNLSSSVSDLNSSASNTPPPSGLPASTATLPLTAQSSIMSNGLTKLVSESSTNEEDQQSNESKSDSEPTSYSMVNIYSKMLIQLAKKSLPIEDHQNVLTKPYDSSQDVKLFLTERSKILYLSNLPFDTTQSELESWFTQYGARPIAFWTLKNLESNLQGNSQANGTNINSGKNKSKGISGFAVFGTHEEASESLSMNGRALNDRPIEIQPSSTRVLDKASDLLTPFPPSKNRPRPGDWTCPSCGFSNFQRRTACFRCSFPATSAVAFQEQIHPSVMMNRRNNNGHGNGNSPNGSMDKLPLSGTTMNNSQSYNNYGGHQMYNDNHGNNNNNNNHRNYGNGGNQVPFRAGDWKCTNEACQYHNFAKNLVCLKCGMNKPANLHNPNQMNNKMNQLNSVSSTAAAIAAATASGQPLNLNNPYSNNHHQNGLKSHQTAPQQNGYNSNHLYNTNLSRTNSNGTPIQNAMSNINIPNSQLLTQQYFMMQQPPLLENNQISLSPTTNNAGLDSAHTGQTPVHTAPVHTAPVASQLGPSQSISPPNVNGRDYSQSATTSPGLYQAFGYPQYQGNTTPQTTATDPSVNFSSISNQFSSLNLNHS